MSPDVPPPGPGMATPGYGPPGAPGGPPPGAPGGPPPGGMPGAPGGPGAFAPAKPTNPGPAGAVQPAWGDPAAFAATAPPPTTDEYDKGQRTGPPPAGPAPAAGGSSAPPAAAASPAPPAVDPNQQPSSPPAQEAESPAQSEATIATTGKDPLEVGPDAPRVLAGFLVTYEGADLGAFFPIYQGKNVVGRKAAAEGLDIEIDHPTTSSRHAVVHASARPGRFKVEDPGSTNGTFLNDEKLPHKAPHELNDGDILRFGGYATIVKIV